MRFSVITVCLNEAATIHFTCDSLVNQTCDDFEWLVIDGQSTDGTLDVLNEYADRISQLVSEPDDGIYDAMNKGIARARGDYLLFLNAGDSLAHGAVLERVSRCPEHDLLVGDLRCLSAEGEASVKTFPDVLPRFFLRQNMLPHQASFFRRSLFDKYGGYDPRWRIAGDYELFVRLVYRHRVSYYHVPEVLAEFRMDGVSSSPVQRERRRLENHLIRKHYFPWYVYGLKRLTYRLRQTIDAQIS